MWKLSNKYGLEFYIVAVIPLYLKLQKPDVSLIIAYFAVAGLLIYSMRPLKNTSRKRAKEDLALLKFVNIYKKIVSQEHGMFLEENFICDDIHSNSNLIVPFQ